MWFIIILQMIQNKVSILRVTPTLLVAIASILAGCTSNKTVDSSIVPDSVYIQTGNHLVALTFDTLRNSLLKAIGDQGLDGAISFCNERAYPLTHIYTDSASIRRTSIKFRNPDNQPDSLELRMLISMEQKQVLNGQPAAVIVRDDKRELVHFFKPIIVQPMCLNCHGKSDRFIQQPTLQRINQLYPDDLAIDYEEGDFRGLWHITFNSQ